MNMTDAEHFVDAARPDLTGVKLSRTETQTLCFKATRGAGHSWGIAEEAAAAAGWLCSQGIDGTAVLLGALLEGNSGVPQVSEGRWTSQDGEPLCPLRTGTALTDFALLKAGPFRTETAIGPVHQPVLLLPFLATCAEMLGTCVRLEWEQSIIYVGRSIAADAAAVTALTNARSAEVTLALSERLLTDAAPLALACANPDTLAALDALALRTTVPASDASRDSGAGAGTTEND